MRHYKLAMQVSGNLCSQCGVPTSTRKLVGTVCGGPGDVILSFSMRPYTVGLMCKNSPFISSQIWILGASRHSCSEFISSSRQAVSNFFSSAAVPGTPITRVATSSSPDLHLQGSPLSSRMSLRRNLGTPVRPFVDGAKRSTSSVLKVVIVSPDKAETTCNRINGSQASIQTLEHV